MGWCQNRHNEGDAYKNISFKVIFAKKRDCSTVSFKMHFFKIKINNFFQNKFTSTCITNNYSSHQENLHRDHSYRDTTSPRWSFIDIYMYVYSTDSQHKTQGPLFCQFSNIVTRDLVSKISEFRALGINRDMSYFNNPGRSRSVVFRTRRLSQWSVNSIY